MENGMIGDHGVLAIKGRDIDSENVIIHHLKMEVYVMGKHIKKNRALQVIFIQLFFKKQFL